MAEGDHFLVRDTRMPGHFWADNEVLDLYGSHLGAHAFAVYMAMCRSAINGTGECKISTRKLAQQLGMSAGGAYNALVHITRLGLVRQISPGDRSSPGVYVLADVKALVNPEIAQLKLAGRGAHEVSTPALRAHTVSTSAHPVNAGVHPVNEVLTGCTRNKEVKTSLRLKTQNRGRESAPPSQFSQADFDQRDLRKIAEVERELTAKLKGRIGFNDEEITEQQWAEAVCERAGLTVKRYVELRQIQREWPKDNA